MVSQLKDLFGITLAGKEPGEFVPKLKALARASHTINFSAVAIAAATIDIIRESGELPSDQERETRAQRE